MVQQTEAQEVKKLRKYPIIKDKYYILDFSDLTRVRVLNYYFINRRAAEKCIKLNFLRKKDHKYYSVVQGKDINESIPKDREFKGIIYFKYDYPVDKMTKQEMKTYRTVQRRRLRRMDLLTLVKPRKHFNKKPDYIKHIKNKQKVAMSPNSVARVIQLQRKSPDYYYLVLEKETTKKKGLLFILNCLKFNKRTGEMKQVTLKIKRTDLLIPFLIWDLENMIHEKIQRGKKASYYREFGFKTLKGGQKESV